MKPLATVSVATSVEDCIEAEIYFTAAQACDSADGVPLLDNFRAKYESLKNLTFCVLVLSNGTLVTGDSSCGSLENFDSSESKKVAKKSAVDKLLSGSK